MSRLNIVNGMAMLSYLSENDIKLDGETIPFNEGMCEGDATEDIFGGEFSMMRCAVHGVGIEEYEDIVINHLNELFSFDHDETHLFFDDDMFCQINLITLLAYFDVNDYDGRVALHLIDHSFTEINMVEIKPSGFYEIYKTVLIDKRVPEVILPEIMSDAVVKYLDFAGENSEITQYILDNIEINESELLDMLFSRFASYGLGDTSLMKQIEKAKNIGW